jgi:hypothetical protein
MDADSLQAVAEDLEYLGQWGPEISDPEIRRGSATLRRLLVEDAYGQAWRARGFVRQPVLRAVDLMKLIAPLHPSDFAYGIAGGAEFRGLQIAGMLACKVDQQPDAATVQADEKHPALREYTLSELLASTSGFVDGRVFNRREVIKYIANVKGGVHLSDAERKAEAKLIERLGKIEKKIRVHSTDALLVELVAIGQAVGQSPNAQQLVASIRGVNPSIERTCPGSPGHAAHVKR